MLFRYFTREILLTSALVLVALLALFGFFDLIRELDDLGRGNYRLTAMLGYVALIAPVARLRAAARGRPHRDALRAGAHVGAIRAHGDARLGAVAAASSRCTWPARAS